MRFKDSCEFVPPHNPAEQKRKLVIRPGTNSYPKGYRFRCNLATRIDRCLNDRDRVYESLRTFHAVDKSIGVLGLLKLLIGNGNDAALGTEISEMFR